MHMHYQHIQVLTVLQESMVNNNAQDKGTTSPLAAVAHQLSFRIVDIC